MLTNIPGTVLPYNGEMPDNVFGLIRPVLTATGGVTLSQLSTFTGLEGTTIQNWIKRGWVVNVAGKKYYERQVLRILLINMLRGMMKLEDIASLMSYVNGSVEDTSDDIIPDIELYNLFCMIIFDVNSTLSYDRKLIQEIINKKLRDKGLSPEAEKKLHRALMVMVLAYIANSLKRELDTSFKVMLE